MNQIFKKILCTALSTVLLLLSAGCELISQENDPRYYYEPHTEKIETTAPVSEQQTEDVSEEREKPTEASPEPEICSVPMLETRFFLSQLEDSELEFCSFVYRGISELEETISVPTEPGLSFERADELVRALINDCPELIMCAGGYSLHGTQTTVTKLKFKYRMSKKEYLAQSAELEAILNELKTETAGMDAYETELFVHDKICGICSYSAGGASSDSADGALVEGAALCQGYSKAFQLAMQSLGFKCAFVSNEELVHGWNLIELDGEFYQLDLTWDDSGDKSNYPYFNLNDALAADFGHMYDKAEAWTYPECTSLEYNYYYRTGNYIPRGTDVYPLFMAALDEMYASGGGELNLLFEDSDALRELIFVQGDWINEWNADKYISVRFTRTIIENNDYVYITRFEFIGDTAPETEPDAGNAA